MLFKLKGWRKLVTILMVLGLFLGFSSFLVPGTVNAANPVTIKVDGQVIHTFTMEELQAMESDEEAWVEARIYSTINTWPTKNWYVSEGVKLKALFEKAKILGDSNVDLDDIKVINVKSTDSFLAAFTKKQLFDDTRYYFPGLKENHQFFGQIPGEVDDGDLKPEPVEAIIALRSVEASDNPDYMKPLNCPLFVLGQRWITEQTNHTFVKNTLEVNFLTSAPLKWASPVATVTPPFTPEGKVPMGAEVRLTNEYNDADKIYYTTDGTDPTYKSPIYNWIASRWWSNRAADLDEVNKPIKITEDTVIKAITIGNGREDSDIAIFEYTVETVAVTGVSILDGDQTLYAGDTIQLNAVVEPETATNKSVTWSSSDVAVAVVGEGGLVTAEAEGTATITVTTGDGGFTDSVTINVEPTIEPPVFTVKLDGVETASYTLPEIKAMPATTKIYGETGYYERRGVDFLYLLESLDIDHENWPIKLIMKDGTPVLNFSNVTEPLLAYEESQGGDEFEPFPANNPLKLYYGDGSNHKLVYQYVIGIEVTKPAEPEPPVFTVKLDGVEIASYTLSEIKAMPATTKIYGETGYYERRGVDFLYLLESLNIDHENWPIKLIMKDGTPILNFSNVTGPLLAYEESQGGDEFEPFPANNPLKLYYGDGSNHKLVYQYVIGIEVTKPAEPEPPVFTVKINGEETASYTLSEIKAMPATAKAYGPTGYYVRRGVDFIYLLESLDIDHENWPVKIIMRDGSSNLNFSMVTEPILAYEESTGGSDFAPFPANNLLKLYYGDGSNQNLVYQYVQGIEVTKPELLAAPELTADGTGNTAGNPVELIFTDDEAWRGAVTAVLVNDSLLSGDDYTLTAGRLTIVAGVFTAAGEYNIVVQAAGYENAAVIQGILEQAGEVPPVLTAGDQANTAGNPVIIKYTDPYPPQWEPKITSVSVDGIDLEPWQYNVGFSKLTIAAGIFNEAGDYTVTVKATGYQDTTVIQQIKARPELFVPEGKGNMIYADGCENHTVAIKNDGTVWTWGDGQSGKLGDDTTGSGNWRSFPGQVSDLKDIKTVAVGSGHTLALKDDGTLWAWGSNSYGQLGNGSNVVSTIPVRAAVIDTETNTYLEGIKAIAACGEYSLALKDDGTVWAWGSSRYGQLGNGVSSFSAKSLVPVQVIIDLDTGTALTDIQAIAAGKEHALALKNDGTVWTWGRNYYGQLGTGQSRSQLEQSAVAVQVITDSETGAVLTDVKAVAAGHNQCFALKNDGTVWAWGWNGNAQIGNGDTTDSSVPLQTARLTDIQYVSGGANHAMALGNDGTIWVWGSNYYGQLGIGTNVTSYIPTQLYLGNDIAMINAGDYYSMAVKTDGTVWSWGQNTKGKVGNGTIENYPADVPIPNQVKLAPQTVIPASVILGDTVELDFTDDLAWRESIFAVSVDGNDLTSEQYAVDDGKITIVADVFTEVKEYTIAIKAEGFLDAVVVLQVQLLPSYKVVPVEDAAYTIGETENGIKTMTVNEGQTGLKYFTVFIEPNVAHEGTETVVFTHLRDGIQLQLNALEADFDEIDMAKAGFNVSPGDVIKVYIVDELTNDSESNPIVLQ